MSKINTAIKIINDKGIKELFLLIKKRIKSCDIKIIKKNNFNKNYFIDKVGIEIGGPSKIFSKEIPIYQIAKCVDGVNFSNDTVWEGKIKQGLNYNYFNKKVGNQFICEANNLEEVQSEKYDFLIASHCLEHCANVLKTIDEWKRVVKKGGVILLILPDKNYTFDHKRKYTPYSHLLEDYNRKIDEKDLNHLDEILKYHDLSMDKAAGDFRQFKNRSLDNFSNRCLHHHVFDFKLLKKIFKNQNIKTINTMFIRPFHKVIIGVKK